MSLQSGKKYLVYLHGFRSSAHSKKSRELSAWFAERGLTEQLFAPSLPVDAHQAIELVQDWITLRGPQNVTVVGSSLGGFYATYLAECVGTKAVLINPPVAPQNDLAQYIGPQTLYVTDEPYDFTLAHVAALGTYDCPHLSYPERIWLLAETADETCPYQRSMLHYARCRQTIIEGGDHSFQSFTRFIPAIVAFAGITDTDL